MRPRFSPHTGTRLAADGGMARVAFIVAEDFEDSELRVPRDGITGAGHEVVVIASDPGPEALEGKRRKEKVAPDLGIAQATAADFDALVIPGGYSPDKLRMDARMVRFTRDMFDDDKIVAAVCRAPSLLIEADLVEHRTLTSWPSIKTDLVNAGANWVDRAVVEDGNLITSRNPDDLPEFTAAILQQLARRKPERTQHA
jgi:protease I